MVDDLAFEIPSKTFIVGEYLAINGTASLLLATEPCFYTKVINDSRYKFHPDGPAGHLMKDLGLNKTGFSFFDPHGGRGGFGRSTAEYLSVYLYDQVVNHQVKDFTDSILNNLESFIAQYRKACGKEYKPSGADLVAQVCGGLCWFDGMNLNVETLVWPFPGYDIFIYHTGRKLATHEHLKELKNLNLRPLIPYLIAAKTAIDQANLRHFCDSLNFYYDTLAVLNLSDKRICESVATLRADPKVLAAKGCGAMGVDTVIVVAEKSDAKYIKELCSNEDFQFISTLSNAHGGASIRREI